MAERLQLDGDHARDLLDQLDDLAGGDTLPEPALVEGECGGRPSATPAPGPGRGRMSGVSTTDRAVKVNSTGT